MCMHFRRGRSKQIEFEFTVGRNVLEIVEQYKYLGVTFNSKGNFTLNTNTLGKAAGRALEKIISKIHILKDFGFKSYEKLYYSCVVPTEGTASFVFTFPTIFHYISWVCFFNPQRGIACFPSRNTLYSGSPRYVVDCLGNPSRKTRQHFMDWYTAHV